MNEMGFALAQVPKASLAFIGLQEASPCLGLLSAAGAGAGAGLAERSRTHSAHGNGSNRPAVVHTANVPVHGLLPSPLH